MITSILRRIQRVRSYFPTYMALRAGPWAWAFLFPLVYAICVPRRQPFGVLVLTMGKVGTLSFRHTLHLHGVGLAPVTHRLGHGGPDYPFTPANGVTTTWPKEIQYRWHQPWMTRRRRVGILTAVREPLARLISLYLWAYTRIYNEPVGEAAVDTLLERFPQIFAREYRQFILPGEFFATEVQAHFGIDVYAHPLSADGGSVRIEQGRISLLVLKLESSPAQQSAALSDWIEQPIAQIARINSARDVGYAERYAEFSRRVRLPRAYAEQIYASAYMQHFYTAEERARYWAKWSGQLDATFELSADWRARLAKFHPPVVG